MVTKLYTCVVLGAVLCTNCKEADPSAGMTDDVARSPSGHRGSELSAPSSASGATTAFAPPSGQTNSASSASPSGTATAPLRSTETLTDSQIAAVTEGVNTAEVQQAELARTRSKQASVRGFAAMMIEHHGAAKREQAQLKLAQQPSDLSRRLAAEAKATLDKLRNASSQDFDRSYFQAQVDGHQTVLDALNRDLIPQAKDPRLQGYLKELTPKVEHHLKEARAGLQSFPSPVPSVGPAERAAAAVGGVSSVGETLVKGAAGGTPGTMPTGNGAPSNGNASSRAGIANSGGQGPARRAVLRLSGEPALLAQARRDHFFDSSSYRVRRPSPLFRTLIVSGKAGGRRSLGVSAETSRGARSAVSKPYCTLLGSDFTYALTSPPAAAGVNA